MVAVARRLRWRHLRLSRLSGPGARGGGAAVVASTSRPNDRRAGQHAAQQRWEEIARNLRLASSSSLSYRIQICAAMMSRTQPLQ